jgi:quinol monooxygenase YgiN
MEKRSLSLSDLFLPKKQPARNRSLPRPLSNAVWLSRSCEAWSGAVDKSNFVDENLKLQSSPKLTRRKERRAAVDRVIERLKRMPTRRTESMQNLISRLVANVMPIATPEQKKQLEKLEFVGRKALLKAIARNDTEKMIEAPSGCWTLAILQCVQFSTRWYLIEVWASAEEPECCLRSSDTPLYKLWLTLIPDAADVQLHPATYFAALLQIWDAMPEENCLLLHHLQRCLPLEEIFGIPVVMYLTFMLVWFSQHSQPKALLALLKAKQKVLSLQWSKEEKYLETYTERSSDSA